MLFASSYQVVEITDEVLESASAAGCRQSLDDQLVSGENFFLQVLEALQKGKQIPTVKRDKLLLFMLNQVGALAGWDVLDLRVRLSLLGGSGLRVNCG